VANQNQFQLLIQRRFAPFFVAQFLGALNDNVLRNGLIILFTFQGVQILGMGADQLANLSAALFILPFLLFSSLAGQFADKYEKSRLIRNIKLLEVGLMLVGYFAFSTQNYWLLLVVLFLAGLQSTLFGPVKYAYLPQNLEQQELVGGNALVESGTYIAVIAGLIIGGLAVANGGGLIGACLVSFAALGYLASLSVPETRAADPELRINRNIWRETWHIVSYAREKRSVFLAILGISWFWTLGAALTIQMAGFTLYTLNGNESITTLLLALFAVGVGVGSLLCEWLSGRRIEPGLVPFGAIGLSLFTIDLYFAQPTLHPVAVTSVAEFIVRSGSSRLLFDVVMIGVFAGFYSVPLYAMVQDRSERKHLSRIIAANNIINAIFMVAGALFCFLVLAAGFSIPQLFVMLAFINAGVAIYIILLAPEFLMRFIVWILVNLLYRINVRGLERIPDRGPAILVCNHVSFVDALVIGGSIHRPVRFVMYYKIFQIPLLRFIFKTAKVIPIASAREDPDVLRDAFDQIEAELRSGNVVCVFPEGGITRDGEVQQFKRGIEQMIKRCPVPVIPMGLGGLWGSWFSRKEKTDATHLFPRRLWSKVSLDIGDPVPPQEVRCENLELLVRTLRGDRR
jgi:1-acyl-sn-glycerol-3-phosphate acyltransferase